MPIPPWSQRRAGPAASDTIGPISAAGNERTGREQRAGTAREPWEPGDQGAQWASTTTYVANLLCVRCASGVPLNHRPNAQQELWRTMADSVHPARQWRLPIPLRHLRVRSSSSSDRCLGVPVGYIERRCRRWW